MKTTLLATLSLSLLLLGGCATSPSVASYGPGSDSAYIKDNRNQRNALLSDAELAQHRRQRQNVLEEEELEKVKQQRTVDNLALPFDVARRIGILR